LAVRFCKTRAQAAGFNSLRKNSTGKSACATKTEPIVSASYLW
jgi:hypothetical protein